MSKTRTIKVDFELRGCPVNKHQLLEVLTAFLHGRAPNIPSHSVCIECKRRGIVCVMVAQGTPCLGPVTQAGCGALCPAYDRGCYGCYGPVGQANAGSLGNHLVAAGAPEVLLKYARSYTGKFLAGILSYPGGRSAS